MAQRLPAEWSMACGVRLDIVVLVLAFSCSACGSPQRVREDQQKALRSLSATVGAIGDAWVSGRVSSRYARTSLEAAQRLLNERHDELGSSPELLADPSLAAISQAQEALGRRTALLWSAVTRGDTSAARAQLEDHRQTNRPAP